MKTTKKTLTFAFILAALLCLLVLSASAYDGTQYGNTGIYYEISDDKVTITGAKSNIEIADIPGSINGYPVTCIGNRAFYNCTGLTNITIPNSVTSIGSGAFGGCTGLTNMTIPDSVTSIGFGAFYGTAWYNSQSDGDVYAGKVYYKYKGTMPSNTSITIKNGTKGIADSAFSRCDGLTNITIPDGVTSIGDDAFYYCTGLTNVTIGNSVKSIGGWAFYGCTGLTNIIIPDSVTSIGNSAFYNCTGLTSVIIGNSVTSIGFEAFYGCTGLTSIQGFIGEALQNLLHL